MLALALIACTNTYHSTSLVADDGFAPYYTDLAEARAVAGAEQHIVVDFYTDW